MYIPYIDTVVISSWPQNIDMVKIAKIFQQVIQNQIGIEEALYEQERLLNNI